MATIDSPAIVAKTLRNDGTYPGDSQCFAISLYINDYNKVTYHFAYSEAEYASAALSPNVHSLIPLWTRSGGLTNAGIRWLQKQP